MQESRYSELIDREADHWGNVRIDPHNPQIWHDPELFEIFFGKEYRHFLERATAVGPRVLELGCGEGALSIELARYGLEVTAIDLSPERIERAKAKSVTPSNPVFQVGDLNRGSLPLEQYNCVVAHDSLHHIYAIRHLVTQAHGALKQGGRLIVMDYAGMGVVRKYIAAVLYAVLPTVQPYAAKWKLRTRLRSFLAIEEKKKHSLEQGSEAYLHEESPFEEISQKSIMREIEKNFQVIEQFSYNPFWYYLAPKIRWPRSLRYRAARLLRRMDEGLCQFWGTKGAYFFIEAKK